MRLFSRSACRIAATDAFRSSVFPGCPSVTYGCRWRSKSFASIGSRSYFLDSESTSSRTARPWMLTPSGIAAPADALRAWATAAFA